MEDVLCQKMCIRDRKSVANMLVDWKAEQDEMKEILGDEYMDYNLVMASTRCV